MSLRAKNSGLGKNFGLTGIRGANRRSDAIFRECRRRQLRRFARVKKLRASPSVILDRTILMRLSFNRGRRRPGDFKKESFFQAQPFFLAANAAKDTF